MPISKIRRIVMEHRRISLALAVAVMFLLGFTAMAGAATLSLVPSKTSVAPGENFTLDIVIDNPTGIAGCAFTLTYPENIVEGPDPDSQGAVTGISSVFFQNFQSTRMHRENTETEGQILFSGANIHLTNGGAPYTTSNMTLFTIPFTVNPSAQIGLQFTFTLQQTQLLNPTAGWGSGQTAAPIPVLVGAVPKTDPNWGDLTKAFPILLGDVAHPFSSVNSSSIQVVTGGPPPTYTVGGTVSYSGKQTGTLHVAAYATSDTNFTNPIGETTYPWSAGTTSKAFQLAVPNGTYYLEGYIDAPATAVGDLAVGTYKTPIVISGVNDSTSRNFGLTDPDIDRDGLPDWWEHKHFGNLNQEANGDYEHDGYTNEWEYKNGTDPMTDDTTNKPGYDSGLDCRVAPWTPGTGKAQMVVSGGTVYVGTNVATAGYWLGAFGPGGDLDCRGVAQVGANGSYSLTVRANTNGETISFKLERCEDSKDIKTLKIREKVTFQANTPVTNKDLHASSGAGALPAIQLLLGD
jgi:Cohesin domain